MAAVEFVNVTKRFENGFTAVEDFSLAIADGELLVLVGPSGCGKSTALRILAGLENPTSGSVLIDGRDMTQVPPQMRDIAMVFQTYALYPHMTVAENIAFGLKLHHVPAEEIHRRVTDAVELLDLTPVLDRKPKQLSGGQRQRVAMGRAIVREPKVFLMDEPLSNLDAKLRVHMRSEIGRLQQRLGVTTMYVTHDQVEAMTMGDRVAVMEKGKLLQIGSPKEIYNHPVNMFVAGFLGSPAMNFTSAHLERDDAGVWVRVFDQRLLLPEGVTVEHPTLADRVGKAVTIGIRPEDLEDNALAKAPTTQSLSARVDLTEELGAQTIAHLMMSDDSGSGLHIGESDEPARMVGSFDPRTAISSGDQIEIAVDTGRIHYFDAETGLAI
jgi:multiple sugar transport system ATP-binding protein